MTKLKIKEVEKIYVKGNQVIFIIKNVHISTSFRRSIDPMLKKEFRKWIQSPTNRDKVGWTYISRYRIVPIDNGNIGYQDSEEMYYRYKGAIEIL